MYSFVVCETECSQENILIAEVSWKAGTRVGDSPVSEIKISA